MTTIKKFAILAVALTLPFPVMAGGYGEAGVRDATVGQMPTETAAVWCPKLRTEVPIELQRQLDCEDGVAVGTAQPAVAPSRFTRGLFGLPPHQPIGGTSALDDDGDPQGIPIVASGDQNDDDRSGPVSKWDRLNELGVTRENFDQQSDEFRLSFDAFARDKDNDADWKDFNP